ERRDRHPEPRRPRPRRVPLHPRVFFDADVRAGAGRAADGEVTCAAWAVWVPGGDLVPGRVSGDAAVGTGRARVSDVRGGEYACVPRPGAVRLRRGRAA